MSASADAGQKRPSGRLPLFRGELAAAALSDKKRAGDSIRLVLPRAIGNCVLKSVPVSELLSIFRAGMEEGA
jgi:3-dehydroquinate synthetase